MRGQYTRSPDSTEPSYLLTPWGERVTRVRVMGTVVDKFVRDDQNYANLRIDDGTETVSVRAWQDAVKELDLYKVGDTVDVIGRVREYSGEIYLTPELIIRVDDPNWELVRELEILTEKRRALKRGVRPQLAAKLQLGQMGAQQTTIAAGTFEGADEAEVEQPLPAVTDEVKGKVVLAIEKLDSGTGVEPEKISSELNLDINAVNDALRVMFVNGEVFEPVTGRFKLAR